MNDLAQSENHEYDAWRFVLASHVPTALGVSIISFVIFLVMVPLQGQERWMTVVTSSIVIAGIAGLAGAINAHAFARDIRARQAVYAAALPGFERLRRAPVRETLRSLRSGILLGWVRPPAGLIGLAVVWIVAGLAIAALIPEVIPDAVRLPASWMLLMSAFFGVDGGMRRAFARRHIRTARAGTP